MTPVASVVICTRNRADVLEENIQSLLQQDHYAYELIYVNDGSTDNTPDILERHRGDKVSIISTHGIGPGMARNEGVARTQGEYILFIDDDATAPPNWITDMIRVADTNDAAVLCGGVAPFAMEDRYERYMHHRMQTTLGPKAKAIKAGPTLSMLIRADIFRDVGGFREEHLEAAEDWDLCLRVGAAGHVVYYAPEPTVVHRYQTDREGVERRITAGARAGVHIARDHYTSVFAYTAYSVYRFVVSPTWVPNAYPKDLRPFAYRMEYLFCKARVKAFFNSLIGRSPI